MEQEKGSTKIRKGKHLNRNERILIEGFLRAGRGETWIATQLGRHRRTIEREVERGLVKRIDSERVVKLAYSADRAQDVPELNASAKGPMVKLKANSVALEFIHRRILISKWSPEVVAARMKQKGMEGAICAKTIYTYIEKGEIPGVGNETLWEKRMRGKTHKALHRRSKRGIPLGRSIDERPVEIADRTQLGAWEIDWVVSGKGKGKAALLTLTERKTRMEIIRKLKDGTQAAVVRKSPSSYRVMVGRWANGWFRRFVVSLDFVYPRESPKGADTVVLPGFRARADTRPMNEWI